jgi:hypothetical protein
MLIARYSATGVLDTTFGDPSSSSGTRTGTTVLDIFGGTNQVTEVAPAMDSSGHILLAGNGYGSAGKFLFLARYSANGTLDSTFGSGGVAATNFGNDNNFVMQLPASNLTIQSNGELVVTGGSFLLPQGHRKPPFAGEETHNSLTLRGDSVILKPRAVLRLGSMDGPSQTDSSL